MRTRLKQRVHIEKSDGSFMEILGTSPNRYWHPDRFKKLPITLIPKTLRHIPDDVTFRDHWQTPCSSLTIAGKCFSDLEGTIRPQLRRIQSSYPCPSPFPRLPNTTPRY